MRLKNLLNSKVFCHQKAKLNNYKFLKANNQLFLILIFVCVKDSIPNVDKQMGSLTEEL
jgi:hypothetical protein